MLSLTVSYTMLALCKVSYLRTHLLKTNIQYLSHFHIPYIILIFKIHPHLCKIIKYNEISSLKTKNPCSFKHRGKCDHVGQGLCGLPSRSIVRITCKDLNKWKNIHLLQCFDIQNFVSKRPESGKRHYRHLI